MFGVIDIELNQRIDDRVTALVELPEGLVFHSGRGSQYTSKAFAKLLKGYGI